MYIIMTFTYDVMDSVLSESFHLTVSPTSPPPNLSAYIVVSLLKVAELSEIKMANNGKMNSSVFVLKKV